MINKNCISLYRFLFSYVPQNWGRLKFEVVVTSGMYTTSSFLNYWLYNWAAKSRSAWRSQTYIKWENRCESEPPCNFFRTSAVYGGQPFITETNKFPTFYGILSFITMFTTASHSSLPSGKLIWLTFLVQFLYYVTLRYAIPSTNTWLSRWHSMWCFSK